MVVVVVAAVAAVAAVEDVAADLPATDLREAPQVQGQVQARALVAQVGPAELQEEVVVPEMLGKHVCFNLIFPGALLRESLVPLLPKGRLMVVENTMAEVLQHHTDLDLRRPAHASHHMP